MRVSHSHIEGLIVLDPNDSSVQPPPPILLFTSRSSSSLQGGQVELTFRIYLQPQDEAFVDSLELYSKLNVCVNLREQCLKETGFKNFQLVILKV